MLTMGKKLKIGDLPPIIRQVSYNAGDIDLQKLTGIKPIVLIFSRYFGCPICQYELEELLGSWPRFDAKNIYFLYVTQSGSEIAQKFIQEKKIPFPVIFGTKEGIYADYGLGMMTITSIAKVPDLMRKAKGKGISHGIYEGWEQQNPGQFIIDLSGKIKYVHYGWQNLSEILDAI
jgi:peroxiredoxin